MKANLSTDYIFTKPGHCQALGHKAKWDPGLTLTKLSLFLLRAFPHLFLEYPPQNLPKPSTPIQSVSKQVTTLTQAINPHFSGFLPSSTYLKLFYPWRSSKRSTFMTILWPTLLMAPLSISISILNLFCLIYPVRMLTHTSFLILSFSEFIIPFSIPDPTCKGILDFQPSLLYWVELCHPWNLWPS